MKKGKLIAIVLAILTAACLVFAGCKEDEPPPPPPTTRGTITFNNTSNEILYWAGVFDTSYNKLYETLTGESILSGASKSFGNISPGFYRVQVAPRDGGIIERSTPVEVEAGKTITVTYNGNTLQ